MRRRAFSRWKKGNHKQRIQWLVCILSSAQWPFDRNFTKAIFVSTVRNSEIHRFFVELWNPQISLLSTEKLKYIGNQLSSCLGFIFMSVNCVYQYHSADILFITCWMLCYFYSVTSNYHCTESLQDDQILSYSNAHLKLMWTLPQVKSTKSVHTQTKPTCMYTKTSNTDLKEVVPSILPFC